MLDRLRRFLPSALRRDEVVVPAVRLAGVITASSSPIARGLSLAGVANPLKKAFSHKRAPAVAILINSPGGSAVQSHLIFKRIRDLAEENDKKVLVFVEDAAASGGYLIALAGDEIIADPSSVVGSIGVIAAGFGLDKAIGKLGIDRRLYTAGDKKGMLDPFQPERAEEVEHLNTMQQDLHETFIDLVEARRGDVLAKDTPDLFSGAFWTGKTAIGLGLIDGFGDVRAVVRERYGETAKLKLIQPERSLFGRRAPGGVALGAPSAGIEDIGYGILAALEERLLWQRLGL